MRKASVVVGAQFGDEGKGKIVDVMAGGMDLIVRYQGGANAGHTIVADGVTYKLHLIPTGVVRGKRSLIGAGVVLDPAALAQELEGLAAGGKEITPAGLGIDFRTHVVLPWHAAIDVARQANKAIGTTGRGIGPAYEDAVARTGITFSDFVQASVLRERLAVIADGKQKQLQLLGGHGPDAAQVEAEFLELAARLAPFACDVSHELSVAMASGKAVLFEGAQGTHLDRNFGTYPFVTSSSTTSGGACVGAGVPPSAIGEVHGIAKAYTTRVGSGPFPTELMDATGERICEKGREYGTTTGRKRRVGWLDVPMLRRSHELNGFTHIHLTKLDVLEGLPELKIAVGYRLADGTQTDLLPATVKEMDSATPQFISVPGFEEIGEAGWKLVAQEGIAKGFAALPEKARQYVEKVEKLVGVRIASASIGPERESIIWAGK
jgi:adenylosuccinate synthase